MHASKINELLTRYLQQNCCRTKFMATVTYIAPSSKERINVILQDLLTIISLLKKEFRIIIIHFKKSPFKIHNFNDSFRALVNPQYTSKDIFKTLI